VYRSVLAPDHSQSRPTGGTPSGAPCPRLTPREHPFDTAPDQERRARTSSLCDPSGSRAKLNSMITARASTGFLGPSTTVHPTNCQLPSPSEQTKNPGRHVAGLQAREIPWVTFVLLRCGDRLKVVYRILVSTREPIDSRAPRNARSQRRSRWCRAVRRASRSRAHSRPRSQGSLVSQSLPPVPSLPRCTSHLQRSGQARRGLFSRTSATKEALVCPREIVTRTRLVTPPPTQRLVRGSGPCINGHAVCSIASGASLRVAFAVIGQTGS